MGRKTSGRNKEGRVVFHDHNGFRVLTNEKENFVITASFLKQRDNPKTAVPMMKQRPSSEILGSRSSAVSFVSEHEDQELYEERSTSFQSRQGNKNSPPMTCPICLDDIINDCVFTSCAHSFHSQCLSNWTRIRKICPLCNSNVDIDSNLEPATYNQVDISSSTTTSTRMIPNEQEFRKTFPSPRIAEQEVSSAPSFFSQALVPALVISAGVVGAGAAILLNSKNKKEKERSSSPECVLM